MRPVAGEFETMVLHDAFLVCWFAGLLVCWFVALCLVESEVFQDFRGDRLAALVACMHLVFVAAGDERPAPAGETKQHAVVRKSAGAGLSASANVDVGVAVAAGTEGLGDPVLEVICVICVICFHGVSMPCGGSIYNEAV